MSEMAESDGGGGGGAAVATTAAATFVDDRGVRRARDAEFVLPLCVGTVAFWLGKKASEEKSHKWTVYVRSPGGDELSRVIDRVTFRLHPSFDDPERVVSKPPYELTETGWGEFDIGIVLHLAADAKCGEVELLHRLKLYSEESSNQSTKKPVVKEVYEELVFSEPPIEFFERVKAAAKEGTKDAVNLELAAHFPPSSEQQDLDKIRGARMRVANSLKKAEGRAMGR